MSGPQRPRSGGQGRPARIDPARRTAYDLLYAVATQDAYANLALPALLTERELTGRDAAFATELAFGTLRQRGLLDAVLARCVTRPYDEVDGSVKDLLRLGAFQLLEMRVPAHAAVGETVSLARDVSGDGVSRFVNAVLRKVSARTREEWLAEITPTDGDVVARLAVTTSHPAWIVSALRDSLGSDDAELEELLAIDNVPPHVTLVARPGRSTPEDLLAHAGTEPGRWSPFAVALRSGPPSAVPEVRTGDAGVQDEGSQLVALALAAAPLGDDRPEAAWLDLCSGPGGKAALLAGLAAERGATLTAVEISTHRARLVRQALDGGPGEHEVVEADGTDPRWATGAYDRVLVDAPCTGLGVLRRRPEARWRRTPADVATLSALQRRLLRNALAAVRVGGVVAYATCSPHLAETDLVVDDVLREVPGFVRLDAWAVLPQVDRGDDTGAELRLWPHRHGTDGMFLALLRRVV